MDTFLIFLQANLLFLLVLAMWIGIILWVYRDASQHHNATLWHHLLGIFFLPGLVLYLTSRKSDFQAIRVSYDSGDTLNTTEPLQHMRPVSATMGIDDIPPTELLTEYEAPFQIAITYQGQVMNTFALGNGVNTIGRDLNAMIQLTIDDTRASRKHAEITVVNDTASIQDVGSKTGTFVDGRRLQARTPTPLRNGSKITFGKHDAVLHHESENDFSPIVIGVSETAPPSTNEQIPNSLLRRRDSRRALHQSKDKTNVAIGRAYTNHSSPIVIDVSETVPPSTNGQVPNFSLRRRDGRRVLYQSKGKTNVSIGRAYTNDYVIVDDRRVQQHHLRIMYEAARRKFRCISLGESETKVENSLFTDGYLDDGNRLTIGKTILIFRLE